MWTMFKACVGAGFLWLGAAVSAAVPMDDLFVFKDPYNCSVGDDFQMLLDGLIRWELVGDNPIGTVATPSVPAAFRNQLGKPTLSVKGDTYTVVVPLKGSWRGLPLHSLVFIQIAESHSGFHLVFDAKCRQVLDAANQAGFRIPESGAAYRDGPVLGVSVGVESRKGRGALYCIDG